MSYLVMECHPGYAIVLDNNGKFLKVANMSYSVGQTVFDVTKMNESSTSSLINYKKRIMAVLSTAACFCILLMGSFSMLLTPYGSVRMKINPDVQVTINRFDYVLSIEGKNEDGIALIQDYKYRYKKISQVSIDLAELAIKDGYLKEGGEIQIAINSSHSKWKSTTESKVIEELTSQFNHIYIHTMDESDSQEVDSSEVKQPESNKENGSTPNKNDSSTQPIKPENNENNHETKEDDDTDDDDIDDDDTDDDIDDDDTDDDIDDDDHDKEEDRDDASDDIEDKNDELENDMEDGNDDDIDSDMDDDIEDDIDEDSNDDDGDMDEDSDDIDEDDDIEENHS